MRLLCVVVAALLAAPACKRQPSEEQEYEAAFRLFRHGELNRASEAVKRRAAGVDSNLRTKWRLLEAEIAIRMNQPQAALALLAEPSAVPELEIRRLVDRCVLWSGRDESLAAAQDALDSARRLIAQNTPRELVLAADLCQGVIFATAGKWEEAERQVRGVATAAEGASPYYRAASLSTLVYTSVSRSRFDAAALYGEQAVAASEQAGEKRLYAASSANLATSYNVLGEFEAAQSLLTRAAAIAEEINTPYWLQNALGEQGNSFYHLGDYGQAAKFYAEAYRVARERGTGEPAKWAGNLATALIEAGRLDEAEHWNRLAMEKAPEDPYYLSNTAEIWKLRGNTDRALAENRRARERSRGNPELSRTLHAQLASIHLARGNAAAARSEFEAALRMIERDRRGLSGSRFQIGFLARLIRHYQSYVAALVERGDAAAALQVAERSRARVMADRLGRARDASAFDARALARKSGSVLVSYWIAPEESYVWVVTPASLRVEKLPPRKQVDEIVQAYRKVVEESLNDPLTSGAGKRFYETLVYPAAKHIEPGSSVIVSPDGSLHQVNLESAPVPGERPHYWVEDVTVSIAPSLAVLDAASPFKATSAALLIGAPETADPRYPALPNAGVELASVRAMLSNSEAVVRQGAAATPGAFLESSPGRFDVIHFAAHGESNRESPLESAVILSQSDRGFKLYARDVIGLPLRAGLITISGCRSAGARSYSGEGLVGFAWAFLLAGVESVVAGLWEVGDRSTADLMRDMYREIAGGATPADALHAAKLAMIRKGGRAAYAREWAAFQTYIRTVHRKNSTAR